MPLTLSPARPRLAIFALVGLAALLFVAVLIVPAPGPALRTQVFFDAAHLPWFALLTVLLDTARRRWTTRGLAPLFAVLLLLAVAGELLQLTRAGREVGWPDIARNVLGAAFGLAVSRALSERRWARGALLAALLLALTLVAPLRLEWARQGRAQALPLLFDAERTGWRALQSANVPVRQRCMPAARGCEAALAVPVDAQPWPGIRLLELDQDWRTFDRLCADVYVEAEAPIRLLAGLRHMGPEAGSARSTALFVVPGRQRVCFPLERLTPAPNGAHRARELVLYSEGAYAGARWLLRRVVLE